MDYRSQPPLSQYPPPYSPAPVGPRFKAKNATTSMVLGVVGVVSFGLNLVCQLIGIAPFLFAMIGLIFGTVGVISVILAIIYGLKAREAIERDPRLMGREQAQAGFVLGIIGTALGTISAVSGFVITAF